MALISDKKRSFLSDEVRDAVVSLVKVLGLMKGCFLFLNAHVTASFIGQLDNCVRCAMNLQRF